MGKLFDIINKSWENVRQSRVGRNAMSLFLSGAMTFMPVGSVGQGSEQHSNNSDSLIHLSVVDDYVDDKPVSDAFVELFRDGESVLSGYTDDNGEIVLDYATSVEDINPAIIGDAYPNPTQGLVRTDFKSSGGRADVSLINTIGQEVLGKQRDVSHGTYSVNVDLSGLPPGAYFKVISQGDSREASKILKSSGSGGSPSISFSVSDDVSIKSGESDSSDESYFISVSRDDYDDKTFDVDINGDLTLLKYLSRNNEVSFSAKDEHGDPKVLDLGVNGDVISTPHSDTYKSGVLSFEGVLEPVLPTSYEIPSVDKDFLFKERDVRFVYPNNSTISNLDVLINGNEFFFEDRKIVNFLNDSYSVVVDDSRVEPLDTVVNLVDSSVFELRERISFDNFPEVIDLANNDYLEINLDDIVSFGTGKDSVWVSTSGAGEVVDGNKVFPHIDHYANDLSLTIHALAENGTLAEEDFSLSVRPITPRKVVTLKESDLGSVQPGFVILSGDTIPAVSGSLEFHVPEGKDSVQTRLSHPYDLDRKWSFIRTTDIPSDNHFDAYNVDFYLRDIDGVVEDSLHVPGFDTNEENMTHERFRRFMKFMHYMGRANHLNEYDHDDYEYIWNYNNTLNYWAESNHGRNPDSIYVYQTNITYEYDNNDIIDYEYHTMEQATIDRIFDQYDEWLKDIVGDIPIAVKDTFDSDYVNKPHIVPENYNIVYITPRNTLVDNIGLHGTITVNRTPEGVVKYSRINLQTNPEHVNDDIMNGAVIHELMSAFGNNAMTRVQGGNPHAHRYETNLSSPIFALEPTLYDLKLTRVVAQEAYVQGEPLDKTFRLTQEELDVYQEIDTKSDKSSSKTNTTLDGFMGVKYE